MSNQDLKNLFTPSSGMVPPYLAGRREEQDFFLNCVNRLKKKMSPIQEMIVYGPRGNGKTTLLSYLEKETLKKEQAKLEILWANPYQLENQKEFADLIMGKDHKIRRMIRNAVDTLHIEIGSARAGVDLSKSTTNLMNLLRTKSQIKPLILIIDEAHTMKPEVGHALLNTSQFMRTKGNPFLLVLAGTPNLKSTLTKADASFWIRSKIMPLGRLSPEEARQAITIPLEEAGVSFASGTAEQIVARTNCYPYLIQVWGECLAMRIHEAGDRTISMETVQKAEAAATKERNKMYAVHYREIERITGLLPVADSVANTFIHLGEPTLHGSVLKEAIARGMAGQDEPITDDRIMENLEQLSHLGYVWQIGAADYEPGIPSLMNYVHRNSVAQQPKAETTPAGKDR